MNSIAELAAQIADPTDRIRLEAFGRDYPTPEHAWLARCAAFPVALTTDLLYKIWLNFRQSEADKPLEIPINAVGDVLLSSLCREIGYDLYEMFPEVRAVLWQSLTPEIVRSLAEFMLRYLDFCRDKVPSDAFAEAQRVWAESFQHPEKVTQLLHQLLSERNTNPGSKLMAEYVLSWVKNRNHWATKTITEPTVQRDTLSDLAQLAEGIQQYEKGEFSEANATFSSLAHLLQAPRTGGFNVPIPKEIWENLPVVNVVQEPPKGKIYAVLVGIDEYHFIKPLNGCVNDILSWKQFFGEFFHFESTITLLNADATKKSILTTLENTLAQLRAEDTFLFIFSGHASNIEFPHLIGAYDTNTAQKQSYISEIELKSLFTQTDFKNPFVIVILDSNTGSSGWIDTNNEKHILLAATAHREMSLEANNKGVFTSVLQSILDDNETKYISYRKLIREGFNKIKGANYKQTPQLFGHPMAVNQAFLAGSIEQNTYINELIQNTDYNNIEKLSEDFAIESQEDKFIAILEKYTLLKDAKKLKVVRISSEMSVRQIPVFQREYLKSLPYQVEIKDISLFYAPSRAGLKDSMGYQEDIEDDLSALQDAHVIVFVLNRALVNDFARHSAIAPVINHLRRFEYKVVCSILWEDCDRGNTALREYPIFSLRQPLSRASFQKYNFAPEVEREIEEYYQDWQPVINRWIIDLAELGFENELQERIEKAKQTQELDLSGMGFERLPEAVWELKDLKTIDLYNNKLAELPESLTQFQSLEKLYASKNPITSLPLFLTDLPNLRVLKIDDAQIKEFPAWLCKHPVLEDISLENNQIEIIPSALKDLPKLRLFDFRGNPVINLPDNILKSSKGKLVSFINTIRAEYTRSIRPYPEFTFLLLAKDNWNNNNFPFVSEMFPDNLIINFSLYIESFEIIYFFPHTQLKTLFINIFEDLSSNTDVLFKLFLEYPTGTIFFLNFSNSKRLAEQLYQQKHSPIIAYEGELDEKEALEAVRLFYGHYQESKNAMAAFDQMVLRLVDFQSSSKGLYILYRY